MAFLFSSAWIAKSRPRRGSDDPLRTGFGSTESGNDYNKRGVVQALYQGCKKGEAFTLHFLRRQIWTGMDSDCFCLPREGRSGKGSLSDSHGAGKGDFGMVHFSQKTG
ncbi:hypothetical protein D6833_05340 [Candidatus Parcubacteria bacterium]|nr:MAG: hypothetical protein D6833_05340 [Candidatus Parcubacteria bacterium]